MTLTMKQLLAMCKSAMKEQHERDVKLLHEILLRSIQDQPMLELNEEVQECLNKFREYNDAKAN